MAHGSKKPPYRITPKWLGYTKDDVEKLVVQLSKERRSSAQIGMILRDQYGIPDVKTLTKKSVSEIIKKHGVGGDIPEDMMSLLKKAVELRAHLGRNKADKASKYGLEKLESKIRRFGKYYSRSGKLPKGWK